MTTDTEYIPHAADACREAAGRITVVLALLSDHVNVCQPVPEDSEDGTGGWELSIMRETLEAIRGMLHKAANKKAGAR